MNQVKARLGSPERLMKLRYLYHGVIDNPAEPAQAAVIANNMCQFGYRERSVQVKRQGGSSQYDTSSGSRSRRALREKQPRNSIWKYIQALGMSRDANATHQVCGYRFTSKSRIGRENKDKWTSTIERYKLEVHDAENHRLVTVFIVGTETKVEDQALRTTGGQNRGSES